MRNWQDVGGFWDSPMRSRTGTVSISSATALAAASLLGLAGLPSEADARQRSACSPTGVRMLAASKSARVYRKRPDKYGYARVYGCLRSRGVPVYLGTDDEDFGSIYSISLAGSFIGYGRSVATGSRTAVHGFNVVNLRSGRQTRFLDRYIVDTTAGQDPTVGQEDELFDLQITPRGSVVWIDEYRPFVPCAEPGRQGCRGESTREVRLVEAGGGPRSILPGEPGTYRVLDSSPDIAKTSLHRRGGLIYWFRGGARQSAQVR